MQTTGKNAVIDWDGTIYACLTDIDVSATGDEVTEQCSSQGNGLPTSLSEVGAAKWVVTTTIKMDSEDPAKWEAFNMGKAGVLKAYLFGNMKDKVETAFTGAKINSHSGKSNVTTFGALDVAWLCDGDPSWTKIAADPAVVPAHA